MQALELSKTRRGKVQIAEMDTEFRKERADIVEEQVSSAQST